MDERDKRTIEKMIEDLNDFEFKYREELGTPNRCRDAKYELEKIE